MISFITLVAAESAESDKDRLKLIGKNFSEAVKYADAKLWDKAEKEVKKINNGVASDVIKWLELRDGTQNFSEYESFLFTNYDWPGIKFLKTKAELSIDSSVSTERIKKYFLNNEVLTGHGALKLAQAYVANDDILRGNAIIKRSWLEHSYSSKDFAEVVKHFGRFLEKYNDKRIDNLLWFRRSEDVRQMIDLVDNDSKELALARIALQEQSYGVDGIIRNLPLNLRTDPGLIYDRFSFRRKRNLQEGAENLLIEFSKSSGLLGRPFMWAEGREAYARRALLIGDIDKAYRLASEHYIDFSKYDEVPELADLEWLAGFIAFEFLNDYNRALIHFQNFAMFVVNPVNRSRASYWIGRAYEGLKDKEKARRAYAEGAAYQIFFYGQLAAERGKFESDKSITKLNKRYDWETADFMTSSTVKAAILLFYSGRSVLSDRFFSHSSERLSKTDRLKLSQLVADLGLLASGISIAKTAALSGIFIPEFSFPALDKTFSIDSQLAPLINSVIRQESRFFNRAKSSAGAVGLMQVMPNTAKSVSKKMDLIFNKNKLASDEKYNVAIGSQFLNMMLSRFEGSKILAIASYNAGPFRVQKWCNDFGDPRSKGVDPLVWIELIPYSETRNYVKRVMESEWVYSGKFMGKPKKLNMGRQAFGHQL
jgi:soluble lytic murein transglycosylase